MNWGIEEWKMKDPSILMFDSNVIFFFVDHRDRCRESYLVLLIVSYLCGRSFFPVIWYLWLFLIFVTAPSAVTGYFLSSYPCDSFLFTVTWYFWSFLIFCASFLFTVIWYFWSFLIFVSAPSSLLHDISDHFLSLSAPSSMLSDISNHFLSLCQLPLRCYLIFLIVSYLCDSSFFHVTWYFWSFLMFVPASSAVIWYFLSLIFIIFVSAPSSLLLDISDHFLSLCQFPLLLCDIFDHFLSLSAPSSMLPDISDRFLSLCQLPLRRYLIFLIKLYLCVSSFFHVIWYFCFGGGGGGGLPLCQLLLPALHCGGTLPNLKQKSPAVWGTTDAWSWVGSELHFSSSLLFHLLCLLVPFLLRFHSLPQWLSGKASPEEQETGDRSPPSLVESYLWQRNWFSCGYPAWHFRISCRTGWPGVSMLVLGEVVIVRFEYDYY